MHSSIGLLSTGVGATPVVLGWLLLRWVGNFRWLCSVPLLLLDLFLPLACFALLATATAKPIFAGMTTFALAAGFAYANRSKLKVLAEPVVFTDVFQAFDIFRHPRLALPFPHKGRVLGGAAAVVGVFALLFWIEPSAWQWTMWPFASTVGLVTLVSLLLAGRFSASTAIKLRKAGLSGEPAADATRFGTLGALLAYGIVARGERPLRQAAVPPAASSSSTTTSTSPGQLAPVVVVQCESFFDARRLHPGIRPTLLPVFDRCRRNGVQWGRLEVPCWGANTVRTEFAVLSGLSQDAIGFDRFNPYHRFAGVPINSLAWQLRAEGYRTVCVHPFDRTFYGRDRVMSNLGFDEFLGEEAFVGARRINGYIADVEVARKIAEIVRLHGPRVFVFAITMENHGPWSAPCERPIANLLPDLRLQEPERVALERYLQSLRNADDMLDILVEALNAERMQGLLAFYGDHLPAFRSAFAELGLRDLRSDYFIWRAGVSVSRRLDIAAQDLGAALLDARRMNPRATLPSRNRRSAGAHAK